MAQAEVSPTGKARAIRAALSSRPGIAKVTISKNRDCFSSQPGKPGKRGSRPSREVANLDAGFTSHPAILFLHIPILCRPVFCFLDEIVQDRLLGF